MDIEVNNIKIHYEALGEGKSIILLNPNSVNTGLMKFIANRLKGKYKVYPYNKLNDSLLPNYKTEFKKNMDIVRKIDKNIKTIFTKEA